MHEFITLNHSLVFFGYSGCQETLIRASGAAGYVGKPYQVTDLPAKVRSALDGADLRPVISTSSL